MRGYFRFRNFHTKLFLSYSIIVIILLLIIAIPIYYYLKDNLVRNQDALVEQALSSTVNNLNLFESQYENYTKQIYLIRNYGNNQQDTLVKQLYDMKHQIADPYLTNQSVQNFIALGQETYRRWDRISILLTDGTVYSNKPYSPLVAADDLIEDALRMGGAVTVRYEEYDPFDPDRQVPVVTISRILQEQGEPAGVLHVQVKASDIVDPTALKSLPFETVMILSHGSPIYHYSISQVEPAEISVDQLNNSKDSLAFYRPSQSGDLAVYMKVDLNRLYEPINKFRWSMVSVVAFLLIFSLGIYYYLARILTFPLKKIRKALDSLQLNDDEVWREIEFNKSPYLDEMELINRSFRKMNARLQQSLSESVKFHQLQLQSQFDLLQAQINPHFLFNMLGVLQVLSDHGESQLVSSLSVKLADFLKYTIGTHEAKATLKEEFQKTEMYLDLMKSRYQHRLNYWISLEESAHELLLPKLILQPFVENSLKHGYKNINHPMLIEITGKQEHNVIQVEIRDNGNGFEPLQLEQLTNSMDQHLFSYRSGKQNPISIGGMGIISTFLRLKLMYNELADLEIHSIESGGVLIRLRIKISALEGAH